MSKQFRIPATKFKRNYLEVPSEFVDLTASTNEKEPLFFEDPRGNSYIFELYPDRKLLGGMAEWWRRSGAKSGDTIIIDVVDGGAKKLRIALDTAGKSKQYEIEGLFVGKRFNFVGAKKFELGNDHYLGLQDLNKHIFICGVTGSGKTVLGKAIVEECATKEIPTILIDLKGDLSSLALVPRDEKDFIRWVEKRAFERKETAAAREAARHFDALEQFGITLDDVLKFTQKSEVRIFTPRSNKGIQLGFGSPLAAPPDVKNRYNENKTEFANLLASLTTAFIDRLYPGSKRSKVENERTFVFEVVRYAWLNGIDLNGKQGMFKLLRLLEYPPFKEIGGLPVSQYIDAENRRNRLLNKVNTLLSGPESMWFEGKELSMKLFLNSEGKKTPINVINLAHLDHFEDRSFVVAQVAYELNKWMRSLSGTEYPRLLFFIDEIGGGGGKQALFPSYPYECAAKWGLNYLIRQGRSYGVCCMLATQNPGDVDYKGLSNCHTWIIGKLATDRDRKKVMESMEVYGLQANRIQRFITAADTGEFVIKDPRNEISFIRERWLKSYHRVLTTEEIGSISSGRC